MIALEDLLAVLDDRGIAIATGGGRLQVDAPTGIVTPALRSALAAHETALLDYLAGKFTVPIRPDPDPPWTDPRPDLKGDSGRWMLLLEAALARDVMLFGMLNVLRQMGARLELAGPDNWTLLPEGPLPTWKIVRGAEMTARQYDDFRRRYVLQHSEALNALLDAP